MKTLLPYFLNSNSRISLLAGGVVMVAGVFGFAADAKAQVRLPSNLNLNFQTSGPGRCASVGDWYTTNNLGTNPPNCTPNGGTPSSNTDRVHRFFIDITQDMLDANGGSLVITINDAESNGQLDEIGSGTVPIGNVGAVSCPPNTNCDPTQFQLISPTGGVLATQTIAGGSADGTTFGFTVTAAGVYTITSVTAGPISGNNTLNLNDDDNTFSISVPTIAGSSSQALIGQFQGTIQQNTNSPLTLPFYFLVGPGASTLGLRNFDLNENSGAGTNTVTYTRPSGATINGTSGVNGLWNGGGTLNSGQDNVALSGTTSVGVGVGDAGVWGLTINNFTSNNQTLVEANADGNRLVIFDQTPSRAGNFTITPDTTLSTTIGAQVCHPFTVTNNFFTNDIINLTLAGSNPNYTVVLRNAANTANLTDIDGDGALDTGILTPGQTISLNLCATPNPGATTSDVTTISGTSFMDRKVQPTTYQTRAQSVVKTTLIPADLQVVKTTNTPNPTVGQNFTYTVTLTNLGPSAADNVTITDQLPAGVTYISATASQGTYNNTNGLWTVGTIASGATQTLQITVRLDTPNQVTNTASVTSVSQPDPNPNNNTSSTTVQPPADLSLSKTLDTPNPSVGQNITYTLTLNNTGPAGATNVAVTDQLPAGLTFVSSNPSQGTYNSTTGLWTVGNVAANATATLQITATLNTTNGVTNTAQVTASDQPDPDSTPNNNNGGEDDQASVTFPPQIADLSLAKTLDTPNPSVGQNITYTLTLNNTGPATATNVAVTDQLPAGLTFVSSNPSQGTYNSTTGLWTVGNVAANATATLQITATLNTTNGVTNTAQVTASDQPDPDSTPNNNNGGEDDQASVTFPPQIADLSLAKTLDTPNPTLGGNLTYTVTLRNTGPAGATNVAVTDQLPAGLTFVSSNPSQGTYNSTTGLWTVGNVAANATATLQITATLNTTNGVTNTAQVTASDQPDPDSTPNNNNGGEDDQASVNLPPLTADLRLAKTVDNSTPAVGQNINFTLTVTNDGPATATNVQITDTLPAGLTFVSASNGGTYNAVTRQIVWNLASVANGGNVPLTVQATVNNAVTQSNRAEITASDQPDPDSTPNNGNPNEDDYASVTLTSQPAADLAIVKTVDNPNPTPGQTVNYTITLSNLGPGNATNVQVNENIPSGLNFVSATSSQGTYDSNTGLWNAGNIANGSSVTLTIRATVTTANPVTNTAQVTGSDQPDPNPANNSSSVTIPDLPADLAVTKTVDQPNAGPGQTLNYTVTLTNNGPGNASDVAVTDQVPQGLTFLSATPSQGSYDATTGIWTVGNIANGAAVTLTISARVNTANPITNTAQVTASDQSDPVPGNNSASVTTPQQPADLVLAKLVDNPNPSPGQQFTYSIVVTNTGPANATGVQITDQLPTGVNFVSATPSVGTYNNQTGLWNIGNLNNGAAATLRITAVLNAANATNTASITASDQPDPNPNNNQDSVRVPATGADLSLAKTANLGSPRLGDIITYTLTLSNSGPQNATGVQVTDQLPTGLTFVSASGNYDATTGVWTVGNVASGGTATLTIQARKTAEGPVTNTAQVTASDQPDPDSTPGNNNPSEDDQASVTLPQDVADLSLSKTADNLNPTPGTTFSYTVTLRNSGPATATGVQVLEQVPAGLSFVSATPSTGTYDATTGLWNVGQITNGGTATLRLTVTLNTSDVVTNTAQVQASDQGDPDSTPGNNNPGEDDQASLSLPNKPRLRLVKRVTALNGTPFNEVVDDPTDVNDNATNWPVGFLKGRIDGTFIQPGDEVEYTVYFLSDGGALAANVNLCDLVPAGLQFIGDAFGTNRGVSVLLNNNQTISTNAVDGDVGQFFAAGSAVPNSPCKAGNTNGAVVVNLGNLPSATGSNVTGSYGFFRFRARFLQ